MFELRSSAALLIENPLVPVPPLEGVVARARRYRAARRRRQLGTGFVLVALMVAAVARSHEGLAPDAVRVVDDPRLRDERNRVVDEADVPEVSGTAYGWVGPPSMPDPETAEAPDDSWSKIVGVIPCPDVQERIELLMHVPKESLQGSRGERARTAVRRAFEAKEDHCDRVVGLVETTGAFPTDLGRFTAVIGLPEDPELENAIRDGVIDRAGIPVIGGDGLTLAQHHSPHVFPVAPSASALTRIAVDHGRAAGGRTFALVYDRNRTWGMEAKRAFDAYVDRIGGRQAISVSLDPEAWSYRTQAEDFNQVCAGSLCDVVVLAVDENTAMRWFLYNPVPARVETTALPLVLSRAFAQQCTGRIRNSCAGVRVWSPFNAPLPDSMSEYGKAVEYDPDPLVQGAAVAADVVTTRLEAIRPLVTRSKLTELLQRLPYTSPLVPWLSWSSAVPRDGSDSARIYKLEPVGQALHWVEELPVRWWQDPQ